MLGFAVAPAFVDQDYPDVDLGPLDNYPEGEWQIADLLLEIRGRQGVAGGPRTSATTACKDDVPSFTILSNRCVHLGCPTQPQGPPGEPREIETTVGHGRC